MMWQKQLADVTARLEQEIAILREQKLGSQATIDVLNAALKRHERTLQVMQEEHADRLKEQSATHAERLHQEEKHLQQLVDNLADSRARIDSSEENVRRLEGEIVNLRLELKEAQLPSPETEAELRTLRSRVSTLEGAEMMNTVRAKTIESRYRTGDLVRLYDTPCWQFTDHTRWCRMTKRKLSSIPSCAHRKRFTNKSWSPIGMSCVA